MAKFFYRPRQQQTVSSNRSNNNALLPREQAGVGRDDCAAQYPLGAPGAMRARRACEGALVQEVQVKNNVVRYLLVWALVGIAILGFIIYLLVK